MGNGVDFVRPNGATIPLLITRGGRFRALYNLHPKLYQMAMNYTNNGYTLRYALRRMGVQLPDEQPELF